MTEKYTRNFYEVDAIRRNHWEESVTQSTFWVVDCMRYRRIAALCPHSSATLLDIGAGDGYLTDMLRKGGRIAIAADLTTSRLRQIQQSAPQLRPLQMNAVCIPIRSHSLDVVVASEVVEHIENYRNVFWEVYRILAPNGKFIVSVPYKDPLEQIVCPHCLRPFNPSGHVISFDRDNFTAAFQGAGFKDIHIYFTNNAFATRLGRWLRLPFSIVYLIDRWASVLAPHLNRHMIGIGTKLV
jgi:ubiquinone/menaquinone biosynthesis C-methylase UbiE